jgi:amino acid transporter
LTTPQSQEKSGLRRELGFWDVLLFNIAAVLGPRWIARTAHAGQSTLGLWLLAAVFFFLPTALIIVELSTRFPDEGGIYVWTKEAFGDFHGFVAGWCYWVYTLLYFPSLLMASVAMSVYVGGPSYAWLSGNKPYIILASLLTLFVAAWLNLVGVGIGKWLQNAGGIATYAPLTILIILGFAVWIRHGSVTPFSFHAAMPSFNFDTLNFWSSIAFAFTGMELICTMSEEVKNPMRTFPRAIYAAALMIAVIYILGTIATLVMLPAGDVNTQNGAFQAIGSASTTFNIVWLGILAAGLVTIGNAGGVGATVAGVARVPFVAGIDRYLPPAFGRLHPRWHTPYVAILVQAVLSGVILIIANINQTIAGAYELLINATLVVYFIPFIYMYCAVIKLASRPDRRQNASAALIPGGRPGVWIAGLLGFAVTAMSIVFAFIPSMDVSNKALYIFELVFATAAAIMIGLFLYWRGAREKRVDALH